MTELHSEISAFLDQWGGAIARRDKEASLALRTPDSVAKFPTKLPMGRDEEIAFIHDNLHGDVDVLVKDLETSKTDEGAAASYLLRVRMTDAEGRQSDNWAKCQMDLVQGATSDWQLKSFTARLTHEMLQSVISQPVASLKQRIVRKVRGPAPPLPSFQQLAFLPSHPGESYLVERRAAASQPNDEIEFPIPPVNLWLGYNYPEHGAKHVGDMLDIVAASGFQFEAGTRILDLGCGAGRMIRHLLPFTPSCEIWGCDISSEHIEWCKQNLSPPFRFFTNTKVPHLPFADGSFRFIYCGSLFTHIDDLADAWMLEIRRILAPGGCLFATIHDEHTFRILSEGGGPPAVLQHVYDDPVFEKAKDGFDMFTIGRDDLSQVFVSRDYFTRMAGPGFEVLSVTPEAYFYQTAVLLGAK